MLTVAPFGVTVAAKPTAVPGAYNAPLAGALIATVAAEGGATVKLKGVESVDAP
jgi:hypothetical protein